MKKVLVFILIICCLVVFSCETNTSGSSSGSVSGTDSSVSTDYKNKWVLVDFPNPVYAYVNKPFIIIKDFGSYSNFQFVFQCSTNIDLDQLYEIELVATKDNKESVIIQSLKENFIILDETPDMIAVDGFYDDEFAANFDLLLNENSKLEISLRYKENEEDNLINLAIGTIYCSDYLINIDDIERTAPRISEEKFYELIKQNGFGDTNTKQDESSDISNLNNKWLAFIDAHLYVYINDSILVMIEDYEPMSSVPTTLTDTIICKDFNNINISNLEEIELIATKNNENSVIVLSGKDKFIKLTASNYIQANLTGDDKNRFNSLLEEKDDLNISLKYKQIGENIYNSVNIGQIYCADFITNKDERKTTAPRITQEEFIELAKQNGFDSGN